MLRKQITATILQLRDLASAKGVLPFATLYAIANSDTPDQQRRATKDNDMGDFLAN